MNNDLQKWRQLIEEATSGTRALDQALTREAPRREREEDQFARADSYSNVSTVADLISVLHKELDKTLPLVKQDIDQQRLARGEPILALLQKLSRVDLPATANQLYALARQPAAATKTED